MFNVRITYCVRVTQSLLMSLVVVQTVKHFTLKEQKYVHDTQTQCHVPEKTRHPI
jgi:hypothetical protein